MKLASFVVCVCLGHCLVLGFCQEQVSPNSLFKKTVVTNDDSSREFKFERINSKEIPKDVKFICESNIQPKNEIFVGLMVDDGGRSLLNPRFQLLLDGKTVFDGKLNSLAGGTGWFNVYRIKLKETVVLDSFAWAEWQKSQGNIVSFDDVPSLPVKNFKCRRK